jgi:hypothetical protein
MPKETVRDRSGCAATVTWSQDQHVQLATLSTNPKEFVEWCRLLVQNADEIKAAGSGRETPHISTPARLVSDESLGMFWTPDRYQVNQLIRHLRRARNAAFGADE